MVVLGAANSRMKDFFDVFVLASRMVFDHNVLVEAIAHTFERRLTEVPTEAPLALTHEFATIPGKRAQWDAFNRRLVSGSSAPDLTMVIELIAEFAGPVFRAAAKRERSATMWAPGGPWA